MFVLHPKVDEGVPRTNVALTSFFFAGVLILLFDALYLQQQPDRCFNETIWNNTIEITSFEECGRMFMVTRFCIFKVPFATCPHSHSLAPPLRGHALVFMWQWQGMNRQK